MYSLLTQLIACYACTEMKTHQEPQNSCPRPRLHALTLPLKAPKDYEGPQAVPLCWVATATPLVASRMLLGLQHVAARSVYQTHLQAETAVEHQPWRRAASESKSKQLKKGRHSYSVLYCKRLLCYVPLENTQLSVPL